MSRSSAPTRARNCIRYQRTLRISRERCQTGEFDFGIEDGGGLPSLPGEGRIALRALHTSYLVSHTVRCKP